ncbi:lysine-specific demethylase 2A-like isoform X1 [Saccostrea cucullata]|uniref:lysine-specific demethylase 2A-like isoform X1 n=1 Tax=Saccostrea cuccullata TaxID=36930 RepID=UPI002ED62360
MTDSPEAGRKLRVKERKHYTDVDLDDDDIDGKRSYTLDEKLKSNKYSKKYVKELKGEEFGLKYIQEHGLEFPLVFYEKTGLGLRVPSENFKVSDVKQCVGSRRMLDVMDVNTQKGMEMSMREWVQYYENPERQRLLNVISLEFSHTKLENYVESPSFVRQMDWVDTVWPRHLKECQTESTNIIEKMKYPKVQKYCLMSVQGCYTDFHIDFGGTSVWYHILHGEKVFWLIPPTQRNVEIYTNWVLSGKQGDIFLADHVEGCQRIELKQGYTFIIPSGWIHAVFTPKDSLVFGGNFLHSYNIENQLRVSEVEDRTRVPQKFRYPFYTEIAWYVLARYVTCITGKQCLEMPPEDKENEDKREFSPFLQDECSQDGDNSVQSQRPATPKLSKSVTIELTRIDQSSPKHRSVSDEENVTPQCVRSPRKSSSDSCSSADTEIYDKSEDFLGSCANSEFQEKQMGAKQTVQKGKIKTSDSGYKMVHSPSLRPSKRENKTYYLTKWELNGLSQLIQWIEELPSAKKGYPKDVLDPEMLLNDAKQLLEDHADDDQSLACNGEPILVWPVSKKPPKPKVYKTGTGHMKVLKTQQSKGSSSTCIRRRRTRCKKCEPCTRTDCGECNFCKDMKKYGGPGRMKQSCKSRQCLAPVIPNAAVCMICGKDDRVKSAENPEEMVTTLMECCICWEINHPECLRKKLENLESEGVINEDSPNSWECPKCCQDGKQGLLKGRFTRIKREDNLYSPRAGSPASSYDSTAEVKSESEAEGKRVVMKQQKEYTHVDTEEDSLTETEISEDVTLDVSPPPSQLTEVVPNTSPVPTVKKEKKSILQPSLKTKISPKSPKKFGIKRKPGRPAGSSNPPKKRPSWGSLPEKSPKKIKETVITRSGRKVKRSPTLSDENMESEFPKKRPRREGFASRPDDQAETEDKVMESQGLLSSTECKNEATEYSFSSEEVEPFKFFPTKLKKVSGDKQKVESKRGLKQTQGIKRKYGSTKKVKKVENVHKQSTKGTEMKSGGASESVPGKVTEVVQRKFVVRPTAPPPPPDCVELESGGHHPLERVHWTKIFSFLPYPDLARCLSVNKAFYRWGMNHELWPCIDLSKRRICQPHLIGIVKRQPNGLKLNNVVMTQQQLSWLLARIPLLKNLSMSSCSWATVSALCFSSCPLLTALNLNWMLGLDHVHFKDLVTPPSDLRPGMNDVSRLHLLTSLHIAGTEIEDESLQLIPQYLTKLKELDISYCPRITNEGIRKLLETNNAVLTQSLQVIDISGSRVLTSVALDYLVKCINLSVVKIHKCSNITAMSVQKFPRKSVRFLK